MITSKDCSIDLFDFLIWVSFSAGKCGGYVSRSDSRETGEAATADIARALLEDSEVPAREDQRIRHSDIERAYQAWRWAYRLDSKKDILRKLAHAGNITAKADLGHAATMLREYSKRHVQPRRRAHPHIVTSWELGSTEGTMDLPDGRQKFLSDLGHVIKRGLGPSEMGMVAVRTYRNLPALSVGVVEVDGLPLLIQEHGAQIGVAILEEFIEQMNLKDVLSGLVSEYGQKTVDAVSAEVIGSSFSVRNSSALDEKYGSDTVSGILTKLVDLRSEISNVVAAGRISPTCIAIATDIAWRRDLKTSIERAISALTYRKFSAGNDAVLLTMRAGVADFYDYPVDLPRHGCPVAEPMLSTAVVALNQARQSNENRAEIYSPDHSRNTDARPRTPEQKR